MLIKIREKSQGVFAWVILILICVPFALWGIQNYVGGGSEKAIASVGDRDFYQQDLNRAYAQYSQNLGGMNFDEKIIKQQALEKLIQDEVLLQHVQDQDLTVTDVTARKFIKSLDYFQKDKKYDNNLYKASLAAQRISSGEFVNRIKKALVMEQFQRSVIESGFATQQDIEKFFKIQNQKRHVEVMTIALKKVESQPTNEEIDSYYQQQQNMFLTKELVSIEYVELSLDEMAKKIEPSTEQLKSYYEDQRDLYTTKERRKISHILFSFNNNTDDEDQLERALKAKQALQQKDFSVLATEISDDRLTASKGGDLGLFNVGVMEKAFEDAVKLLSLGEVSEPVKSAFGYHLIKVTELVEGEVKSFDLVKNQLKLAYQRSESENNFYELGESLTEISYENPNSLQFVADTLGLEIKKSGLFSKNAGVRADKKSVISEVAIIKAAFSEDVLKGNNSDPVELGSDRLIVLRMTEYKPAEIKPLKVVKVQIIATLLNDKAKKIAVDEAIKIKKAIDDGMSMKEVADTNGLSIKQYTDLSRANGELAWQVNQAVFKAAKPTPENSTVITVAGPSGEQTVINLLVVKDGEMSDSDKAKQKLAITNMGKAFGQADFHATLNSLRSKADVIVNTSE